MAEMVRTAKTADRENGFGAVLSDESFEKFRSIMYMRRAEKGSSLFREGDDADKLYYLFEGRVKSTKTSDAGGSLTLYLHQAGDLMGQMDPFKDSAHAFSAEVTEDAKVGVIQRKDLETLLWQHGDLAVEFMKWMGLRSECGFYRRWQVQHGGEGAHRGRQLSYRLRPGQRDDRYAHPSEMNGKIVKR